MSSKQLGRSRSLKGKDALLEWCKQQTQGYKDVNVCDMSSSWKDGLAFCALLHRFSPELVDFDSLSREDAEKNLDLAFKAAEERLGVPALLDASDLVSMEKVDELSILTYVSMVFKRMNKKASGPASPTSPTSPTGYSKRTLFDVLRDENCNNFSTPKGRKNRLSSGEVNSPSLTESPAQQLQEENNT